MEQKPARVILHIDLDCFFVSVERVLGPSLASKPVLVSGNPQGRGVVSSASYEARQFGVKSGMAIQKARKLCPQAIVLPARMNQYAEFSERVFDLLREFSPLVEEASIDEAYLDLTGTERLLGPRQTVAKKIQRRIRDELGLPASIGIGSSKVVAKVASKQAKPEGIIVVGKGTEAEFLAELPVRALPGVGGRTEAQLKLLGARKIKDLVRLGPELLKRQFGKWGAELWARSQGVGDDEVVSEESAPKSLGKEVTFDQDISEPALIEEWLYLLAIKLGLRLRKRGLFAKTLTLKFRSPDFQTWTRSVPLDPATSQDFELFGHALKILEQEKSRSLVIRLLGITASDLSSIRQLPLFEKEKMEKRDRLFKALDQAHARFGLDSIYPARIIKLVQRGKKEGGKGH